MWFAGPARRVAAAGRPATLRLGFALAPGMRVGLFGGSFNPAHAGHAHVAETALKRVGLDRVIWLVSPQNPLKRGHETAALDRRLRAARRFATGPAMIVSDAETKIGSAYTIDTLRVLKARFPGVRFVWIMGADSLAGFTAGAAGPRSCARSRWRWWPGPGSP
jgi:nicotinate-nucleotide adenylyltransferase